MSKQVRLRRGTTTQHATFIGADGEVTFDTTRKCLVVHDGVTAGGRPLSVYLNNGTLQEISDAVWFTGPDGIDPAVQITNSLYAGGTIEALSAVLVPRIQFKTVDLVYGTTVNLDFAGIPYGSEGFQRQYTSLALMGNVTFTTSNSDSGRFMIVRLLGDSSIRSMTFPGWKFVGGAAPATLGANKTGLLKLWGYGTTDADIVAEWSV